MPDGRSNRLYAYRSITRRLGPYLYPRRERRDADGKFVLTDRAAHVLAFVRERGVTYPRDVRYRFEAYTPMAKRLLGYFAMPLLRRDRASFRRLPEMMFTR